MTRAFNQLLQTFGTSYLDATTINGAIIVTSNVSTNVVEDHDDHFTWEAVHYCRGLVSDLSAGYSRTLKKHRWLWEPPRTLSISLWCISRVWRQTSFITFCGIWYCSMARKHSSCVCFSAFWCCSRTWRRPFYSPWEGIQRCSKIWWQIYSTSALIFVTKAAKIKGAYSLNKMSIMLVFKIGSVGVDRDRARKRNVEE